MARINDRELESRGKLEVVRKVGERRLTHAIHDIDGTHSLIREWPPVMSLSIYHAMTCGLSDDFDSEATVKRLVDQTGARPEHAARSATEMFQYAAKHRLAVVIDPGSGRDSIRLLPSDLKP